MSRFMASLASLLMFLGLLELGARLVYERLAPGPGREIVAYLAGEDNALTRNPRVLAHPYMSFINTPNWSDKNGLQQNNFGYRDNENVTKDKPANEIRILTLGGSTTFAWPYVEDPQDTWSQVLERKLNSEQCEKTFRVLNGGLNSGNSAELLLHYQFQHHFLHFDYAVIHVGANDSGVMLFPDFKKDYSHYRTLYDPVPVKLRPAEKIFLHSYFMRVLYGWWLNDLVDQRFAFGAPSFKEYTANQLLQAAKNNPVTPFENNISALIELMRKDGVVPVLFYVPWAPHERLEELDYPGLRFDEARLLALKKIRNALQRIARNYNIPYLDARDIGLTADDFIDHVHVGREGERKKASYVFSRVGDIFLKGCSN